MPGLRLFTDNHVRGPLIKTLRQRGRDVVRAVDLFGQKNDDPEIFAYAATEERVFLTCDEGIHAIAHDWLSGAHRLPDDLLPHGAPADDVDRQLGRGD